MYISKITFFCDVLISYVRISTSIEVYNYSWDFSRIYFFSRKTTKRHLFAAKNEKKSTKILLLVLPSNMTRNFFGYPTFKSTSRNEGSTRFNWPNLPIRWQGNIFLVTYSTKMYSQLDENWWQNRVLFSHIFRMGFFAKNAKNKVFFLARKNAINPRYKYQLPTSIVV